MCSQSNKQEKFPRENLQTFHSDRSLIEHKKKQVKRRRFTSFHILLGLTVATSAFSILHERRDIKPKEFLEE